MTALIEHHKREGNDVTIALQRVTNPLEFGVVVTDESGRITRFLEKPSWGEVFSDTINTGIYVLEPGILDRMIRGRNYDFSKDLFPDMLRDGAKLGGYIIDAYWTDIGNLEQYQQANYDALEGKVRLDSLGTEIAPGVLAGKDCRIDPSAILHRPVVLGEGVRIGAGVEIVGPTTLGNGCIIEHDARIERAVLWEDCYVGEDAAIRDCTVADRNTIERGATISESTVIGRGCTIGSSAVVNANLKLWPDKWVTSGSVVSMSLIYGQKWPGSLFGSVGISGLANLEFTPEVRAQARPGVRIVSQARPIGDDEPRHASRHARDDTAASFRVCSASASTCWTCARTPLPLARYAVRVGGDGGVHVRVAPNDPNSLLMEFFDQQGITTDKNTERKIENLFFREDFRRTSMDDVGNLDFPSRMLERYTGAFLEALNARAVKEAGFKVVIDYWGNASIVLPQLLGGLGIDQISLNAYFDAQRARNFRGDRERHLEQLATVVTSLEANLGVLIDADGETFTLVDDKGRIVGRNRLFALMTLLIARATPGARIAMPVTIPDAVERIAEQNGAQIIRTRSDRRSLMALAEKDASRWRLRRLRLRVDLPRIPAGVRRPLRCGESDGAARRRAPAGERTRRPAAAMAHGQPQRAVSVGTQRPRDARAPRRIAQRQQRSDDRRHPHLGKRRLGARPPRRIRGRSERDRGKHERRFRRFNRREHGQSHHAPDHLRLIAARTARLSLARRTLSPGTLPRPTSCGCRRRSAARRPPPRRTVRDADDAAPQGPHPAVR